MAYLFYVFCVVSLTVSDRIEKKVDFQEPHSYLALGDSYTIGESVDATLRWPELLVDSMNGVGVSFSKPQIIAKTGWRTDELKQAIEKRNPDRNFDLVSLLIGVNNQYQGSPISQYRTEFEELLVIATKLAGNDKNRVIVLSIPDYGYTKFGESNQEGISREIDDYNSINRQITLQYGIRYYDITPISRKGLEQPYLVASDNLHPSGKQYERWIHLIMKDKNLLSELRNNGLD